MRSVSALVLAGCLALTGIASAQTDPHMAKYRAFKAAEEWLEFVDTGSYAFSWETAASYFQGVIGKEEWAQTVQAVREPLGELISRKIQKATYRTELPGAPDGEYVVIEFESVFENKRQAVETVTPMLDRDGSWKVSGYYIK